LGILNHKKINAPMIKSNFEDLNKTENINGTDYTLKLFIDNSAPCSKCAFLQRSILKCKFPKENYTKKCKSTLGTTHGWNTLEYIPTSIADLYK
jgi:hypothetical protein